MLLRPRIFALGLLALGLLAHARAQQDDPTAAPAPEKHGRKYKAPPETAHIEVTILKGFNKKPIDAAHVIFHPVINGLDQGTYEVRLQVIADGFATYAEDYTIAEPSREIVVSMVRPRAQISTYIDNEGKSADIKPGVQEPIRPKPAAAPASSTTTPPAASSTAPPAASTTPPAANSTGSKPQP
jgi:hypothetical protein